MTDCNEAIAGGALLLTVNQRLARHHIASYHRWQTARGAQWWESPQILPFSAWMADVYSSAMAMGLVDKGLSPPILAQRAWRQCIEQDADTALLDVDAAARLARQSWQLSHAWRCYNDEKQYLSVDQFCWQRWQQRYQEWLSDNGLIDEVLLADELTALFSSPVNAADDAADDAASSTSSLLPRQLLIDGFLQFPPQMQGMLAAIESHGVSVETLARSPQASVHWQAFDDDHSELLAIASQMRSTLERDHTQSLGLIVNDLQRRRTAVLRAFDQVFFPCQSPDEVRKAGRPYDLSLGLPLNEQPLISIALDILALCNQSVTGAAISRILLSPYLLSATEESAARQRLDRRLRDDRVRELDLKTLAEKLPRASLLGARARRFASAHETGDCTLAVWASRFDSWLRLLGWPGERNSEEHQAFTAWLDCLDDLQLLDDGQPVSFDLALREIRQLVQEHVFQPETPAVPIQILGRLESHGLAFDRLWVAGMDDEQWPPIGSADPFLDLAQQQACAIPQAGAGLRLEQAHRELKLWLSQSSQISFCHALTRDGKQLLAARLPDWVTQTTAEDHAASPQQGVWGENGSTVLPVNPAARIREELATETLDDWCGPELPAGSALKGGARLFEDQARCPFRAFALHRLAIRPLEEPGPGLDARQHGTVLHSALEAFWKKTRSHTALVAMDEQILEARVNEAVQAALSPVPMSDELRRLEMMRLNTLLVDWLKNLEIPRPAFEIHSLEQQQTVSHGGIEMQVILDRIDRIGNQLMVVDYKTGTQNQINAWVEQRIRNPQLPLYVLSNNDIDGAVFAQVASNQHKFLGVAADASLIPGVKTTIRPSKDYTGEEPPENWTQWRVHWQQALDVVAQELRRGEAIATPGKKTCLHCELKPLCRTTEQLVSLSQIDDADEQ